MARQCKDITAKRRRQSTRLENLGIPEEELLRQQQELFARARQEQLLADQQHLQQVRRGRGRGGGQCGMAEGVLEDGTGEGTGEGCWGTGQDSTGRETGMAGGRRDGLRGVGDWSRVRTVRDRRRWTLRWMAGVRRRKGRMRESRRIDS